MNKIEKVFAKYGHCCAYCGCSLVNSNYSIDHITPTKKGGSNNISNLNPACRTCNTSKGVKTLEEFRFAIGFKTTKYHPIISPLQAKKLIASCVDIVIPSHLFYFERIANDSFI